MNTVHLPLLPADIMAEAALKTMRWLQKSATVRKSGDLHLVTAGAVVVALAKRVTSFANVPSKSEVREVTALDVSHWGLNVIDPYQTESNYEQYLDHYGTHYAVVDSVPGLALVVTRHEPEGDEANKSPTACYCENNNHEHNTPPTRDHDRCFCTNEIFCWPPVP